MKTTFKPLLIDYDYQREANYKAEVNTHRQRITDFFNTIGKFIEVENKNDYKGNLVGTFLTQFEAKYKDSFPSVMTLNRIVEVCDVPMSTIKKLANEIDHSNIHLDFDTLQEINPLDFGIYTETEEQNKLFLYAKNICDAIYKEDRPTVHFYNADLVRSFAGLMVYDFQKGQIKPSVMLIKNQLR